MKKLLTPILILTISISCNNIRERHYSNSDNTSGGFLNVNFDLNKGHILTLRKQTMRITAPETDTTTVNPWVQDELVVKGTWEINGGMPGERRIICRIDSSKDFVKEGFFDSKFKTEGLTINENVINFPLSTDTIYIFGQPCYQKK